MKKDPDGKPSLAGVWPVMLFMFMTIGLIGLGNALNRQRNQSVIASQTWKPKRKAGTAAGFRVVAEENQVKVEGLQLRPTPDGWNLPKVSGGLKPELLETVKYGDGDLVVAFVAGVPNDHLMRRRSGTEWQFEIDENKAVAGSTTTVVLAGQPAGIFERINVTAIDLQGLPLAPTAVEIGEDRLVAAYEFSRLEPQELQFLRIDAIPTTAPAEMETEAPAPEVADEATPEPANESPGDLAP